MPGTLLYVTTLPAERTIVCADGTEIDVVEFVASYRSVIAALAAEGRVEDKESFGFAITAPRRDDDTAILASWDSPQVFVWLAGGWGPDRVKYSANAVRKLRPLLRNWWAFSDTFDIQSSAPEMFMDKVESINEDGAFEMGDFPYGGAVSVRMGGIVIEFSCSVFSQGHDHIVSQLIGSGLIDEILSHGGLAAKS